MRMTLLRDLLAGPAWMLIAWWAVLFLVGIIEDGGNVHPVVFALPLLTFMFGVACVVELLLRPPPTGKDEGMNKFSKMREALVKHLRDAEVEAGYAHKIATEALERAKFAAKRNQFCDSNAKDLEQKAIKARERVGKIQTVIQNADEAERLDEVDAQIFGSPKPRDFVVTDREVGPWLVVTIFNKRWCEAHIRDDQAGLDAERRRITKLSAGTVMSIYPLRWIKCASDMLVELELSLTLLGNIEPETAPPFCEDIQQRIEAGTAVIAKASAPKPKTPDVPPRPFERCDLCDNALPAVRPRAVGLDLCGQCKKEMWKAAD